MTLLNKLISVVRFSKCYISNTTASITRVHRRDYFLPYLTKVVLSDGSSITVRYHEPRQIIKLPLDMSTLTEAEAKARIESRRPKTKVKMQEENLGSFNAKKYIKLMKKK